jgi:hypothetical protein
MRYYILIVVFVLAFAAPFSHLETVVAEENSSNQEGLDVTLTPRVWFSSLGETEYMFIEEDKAEKTDLPIFGGTVGISKKSSNKDYLLTILAGSGSGEWTSGLAGNPRGTFDGSRRDIEFLIRKPYENPVFYKLYGVRFIGGQLNYRLENLQTDYDISFSVILAEGGYGLSKPLTQSGKHRVIGNFLFGVGGVQYEQPEEYGPSIEGGEYYILDPVQSSIYFAMDANIGYNYVLSNRGSFFIRYRLDWAPGVLIQGPEIGACYTF